MILFIFFIQVCHLFSKTQEGDRLTGERELIKTKSLFLIFLNYFPKLLLTRLCRVIYRLVDFDAVATPVSVAPRHELAVQ
jgi:hypothetical protein